MKKENEKKIIVIGGGVSGLSMGVYGRMHGYEVDIFEAHTITGGLCTSWTRKGYLLDGCIDWLIGTNPDSDFYDQWQDVGALEDQSFVYHDQVMHVEDGKGKSLIVYSDADKLRDHMIGLSPQDANIIEEFTQAIKNGTFSSKTSQPIVEPKFVQMTLEDYLKGFKDTFLREALSAILLPLTPDQYEAIGLVFRLSFYHRKDAAWPVGGSLKFAKNIEKKFQGLGGKVHCNARVDQILIDNNQAVGIRLEDGTEHYADYVVAAIDGHSLLNKLLPENDHVNQLKERYHDDMNLPTSVQVSLGMTCDLSDQPHSLAYKLDQPLKVGMRENDYVYLKNFSHDPSIASSEKSVITSIIPSDYDYWADLYEDNRDQYKLEKEKIGQVFKKAVEKRFPQAKGHVEVVDVSTPLTYTRYANTYKGAYLGWSTSKQEPLPKQIDAIDKLYLTGQWTENAGGLPTAVGTAKSVIEQIIEDNK